MGLLLIDLSKKEKCDMKKMLVILSALVVVLLAIPAIVGQYIHYQVSHNLEEQVWPSGYRTHVQSYHSGWLHSTAQLVVTQGSYQANSKSQIQYPLSVSIFHGPFIFTKDLQENPKLFIKMAVMKGQLQTHDLKLNFLSKMSFTGAISLDLLHKNYRYVQSDGVTATIGEIISQADLSHRWQDLSGHVSIQDLNVLDKGMAIKVPNLTVQYNLNKISKALWLGDRQITIPSVSWLLNNKSQLLLETISLNGHSNMESHKISALGRLQIQKITYQNNHPFGPLEFSYAAKNYSADMLEHFSEIFASMQWDEKNPQTNQQNFQTIIQQGLDLLPGTQHALIFRLNALQSELSLDGNVQFPEKIQQIPNTSFEATFASLMTNAVANIKLQVPVNLSNEFSTYIASYHDLKATISHLQAANVFRLINNNLISELHYEKGIVTINGLPIQEVLAKLKTMPVETQTAPIPTMSHSKPSSSLPSATVIPNSSGAQKMQMPAVKPVAVLKHASLQPQAA